MEMGAAGRQPDASRYPTSKRLLITNLLAIALLNSMNHGYIYTCQFPFMIYPMARKWCARHYCPIAMNDSNTRNSTHASSLRTAFPFKSLIGHAPCNTMKRTGTRTRCENKRGCGAPPLLHGETLRLPRRNSIQ